MRSRLWSGPAVTVGPEAGGVWAKLQESRPEDIRRSEAHILLIPDHITTYTVGNRITTFSATVPLATDRISPWQT